MYTIMCKGTIVMWYVSQFETILFQLTVQFASRFSFVIAYTVHQFYSTAIKLYIFFLLSYKRDVLFTPLVRFKSQLTELMKYLHQADVNSNFKGKKWKLYVCMLYKVL